MNDDESDDRYDDDIFNDLPESEDTGVLKNYADSLNYTGVSGITTDGDEYELRDLMTRARDMVAGGKISEESAQFLQENGEQGEKHRQGAQVAYKTMLQDLQAVAYKDGKPIYEIDSTELWVSCVRAIVTIYSARQSSLTTLAARTLVDNLIYHLPDGTQQDFQSITFRTDERTILRWLEEACYVYYTLTHTVHGDA